MYGPSSTPQRSHHSLSQPVKWRRGVSMLGERNVAHFRTMSRSHQDSPLSASIIPCPNAVELSNIAQFDGVWAWNDRSGQRRILVATTHRAEMRDVSLAEHRD